MSKLQKILNHFEGDLLIPINFDFTKFTKTEIMPPEGYMYCIVTITKDEICIPKVGFKASKEEIYSKIGKKCNMPLYLFFAKFIQNNEDLFTQCKKHRVGYNSANYPKQCKTRRPKPEYKREQSFVIQVLTAKKDWKNLNEYRKQHHIFKFPKKH